MSSDQGVLSLSAAARRGRVHPGVVTLVLLSLSHFLIDLYSGALGVFQPLLVEKLKLTLTQAGILGGTLVFASSVTQPFFGYLSDRYRSRLFSALAPAVAGVFISSLGLAPQFGWALALVLLGGAGVSSFHPQGSSWAAAGLESGKARGMAAFISAGTLGIALSPSIFSWVITRGGLHSAIWVALPGVLVSLFLLAALKPPELPAHVRAENSFDWQPLRDHWKPLSILYAGVFIRSIVQVTYTQFLALYLHRERGFPLNKAAFVLTLYLTAGALGGFIGGHLSDRFGPRRVIMHSFLFSVPFMAWFFFFDQSWLGIAALSVGGLILLFTIPVNVLVGQQLVPSQAGTVSALMMGFAWGTAGIIFIPLTGWISDHTSMHTTLSSLLVFPVFGYLITRQLPKDLGPAELGK